MDKLATIGLENQILYKWYDGMSSRLQHDFFHNNFHLPMLRIV